MIACFCIIHTYIRTYIHTYIHSIIATTLTAIATYVHTEYYVCHRYTHKEDYEARAAVGALCHRRHTTTAAGYHTQYYSRDRPARLPLR